MGHNRQGRTRATVTIVLAVLSVVLTVGVLASPAHAQTSTSSTSSYVITGPGGGTTTTVAPTTSTTTVATAPAAATTTTVKSGGLAFTGADIGMTMGAAAVALGAGGLLVLAARRRKADQ